MRLLEPLPVPERPWESISLDFISSLPAVGGLGSILVVVDQFLKYATFIASSLHCSAEEVAKLMKNVVKFWRVPLNIISDRDSRFLGRFWIELFKLLGSKLYFSISLHPQTDGQIERINPLLERYLRHYAAKKMKKWADLGRRPQEFKVGDMVLVKLQPASLQFFRHRVHKEFVCKYEWPFPIISRVGNVSYKLQLLAWFRIHNVFHASNLKAYHSDPQDDSRNVPTRLPPTRASYEKRVETILADRKIKLPNGAQQIEYLVK
ncbi:hypothetical protein OPV22_025564 [Ensete ventricosum]|uniref:Integrase catalytic domain-containing protein n=1 Tax=Ensete ventricosum TaxID=4639 RepID=A0AAV8P9R0_ENSVE|nr:hypothetical protein OPV22_025564 [Ensete ventricosum]